MNEWPENLPGLDLNWRLLETANKAFRLLIVSLVILTGIGLAQANELPTVLVAETAEWIDFSNWFADGAVGGFDAAGVSVGGW